MRSVFAKAVLWKKLVENPCAQVRRLKVDNRRTRILTEAEQARIIAAFENRIPGWPLSARRLKMQALVQLALVTGARLGELLALTWENCADASLTFLETKNGQSRRIPCSPAVTAILGRLPRQHPFVFANPATKRPYTANGVQHIVRRALLRAGITTGDVTFHTLRHTALSRMIAAGHSDHTVMAISGHSSVRMLERYTHPTQDLKMSALESGAWLAPAEHKLSTRPPSEAVLSDRDRRELDDFVRKSSGGRRGARTRDLRVANAALSQLS